jgi:hypothetical protein
MWSLIGDTRSPDLSNSGAHGYTCLQCGAIDPLSLGKPDGDGLACVAGRNAGPSSQTWHAGRFTKGEIEMSKVASTLVVAVLALVCVGGGVAAARVAGP